MDEKEMLSCACPICGAKPGARCADQLGKLTDCPHNERVLAALWQNSNKKLD
jgi:hypothetical protein